MRPTKYILQLSLNKKEMANFSVKKWIGILLIIIGIGGFIYNANSKNNHNFYSERISNNKPKETKIDFIGGHQYKIKFWGVDEEMTNTYSQPSFSSKINIIKGNGEVLFSSTLISITQREIGGKLVTHDGVTYEHICEANEALVIKTHITDGDYMDVEIYQDLSSEADALPGVFIILAIIGVVLVLRARNKK